MADGRSRFNAYQMLYMARHKFPKGDGIPVQEACHDFWRTHLNNGRNSESLAAFMRPTDEEILEKQRATEAAEKKEHRLQQSRIHSFFR